jgi:hypothetical protein
MRRWRDLLGDEVPLEATPLAWVGRMPDSTDVPAELCNRTDAILGFVYGSVTPKTAAAGCPAWLAWACH